MSKQWNLKTSDVCLEFLDISESIQRSSSYFQTSHISEVESLRVHPCCAGAWVSVQEDLDGELGTCARSPTDDLLRVSGMPETAPDFPRILASLGCPGKARRITC